MEERKKVQRIFSRFIIHRTSETSLGVSIFVHKNLKFTKINLEDYCKDQDLEACALTFILRHLNGGPTAGVRIKWPFNPLKTKLV
jgi:hypothetical protein